jgi:hypothetical protein
LPGRNGGGWCVQQQCDRRGDFGEALGERSRARRSGVVKLLAQGVPERVAQLAGGVGGTRETLGGWEAVSHNGVISAEKDTTQLIGRKYGWR